MRILSWNVNGVRAIIKKGFSDFIKKEAPDIICLQETKNGRDRIQVELPGYKQYWYPAERPGYSGTAIFTKHDPIAVQKGIGVDEHDHEGRVITLEFEDYYLVNVYVPNAKPDLSRLEYRQEWDRALLKFLGRLKKPVIMCGDLNVAHQEVDLARPKQNKGKKGFTDEERAGLQAYLDKGFLDTFRELHPKKIQYSWWSYLGGARKRNVGWRIDYVLASKELLPRIKDSFILDNVQGSDHCPVGIALE